MGIGSCGCSVKGSVAGCGEGCGGSESGNVVST